jgi:hypothetical protein
VSPSGHIVRAFNTSVVILKIQAVAATVAHSMPIVVPVVAIGSTVDLLMVAAYIVHTYSTKAIARSSKRFSSSSKG